MNRFLDIFHKLLESNLARIEYISPHFHNSALTKAIKQWNPELAIAIIDKSKYGMPYLNQSNSQDYTPLMLAVEKIGYMTKDMKPVVLKLLVKLSKAQIMKKNGFHLSASSLANNKGLNINNLLEEAQRREASNVNILKLHPNSVPEDVLNYNVKSFLSPKGGKGKRKYKTNKLKSTRRTKTNKKRKLTK